MDNKRPIIIVKKKVGHGGGPHGGAWKVAYADFVTAMMALFIVLWLMNTSKPVKEAIGRIFPGSSRNCEQAGHRPERCRGKLYLDQGRHADAQGAIREGHSPSQGFRQS